MLKIKVLKDSQVIDQLREEINEMIVNCFEVNVEKFEQERKNLYFSPTFRHLLLYSDNELVSYLRIIKRPTVFDNQQMIIGGIGDVCTRKNQRGRKMAGRLLKEAMKILRREKCDIGLLQTNVKRGAKLYGHVGFTAVHKAYQYRDVNNNLHTTKAKDVMMAPICTPQILNRILKSNELLDIGQGDW